jgi:hypothetical protein
MPHIALELYFSQISHLSINIIAVESCEDSQLTPSFIIWQQRFSGHRYLLCHVDLG